MLIDKRKNLIVINEILTKKARKEIKLVMENYPCLMGCDSEGDFYIWKDNKTIYVDERGEYIEL